MPVEHVSLCRCRVLYLGSAIPLETAVGIESLQAPCRDRYDNVDSNQKASGIDSSLSVYSSGLMLQYAADESSTTWFPIQTLHVCSAVKAVGGGGPLRFVSLDTAAAQRSSNPPLFACIMRRTKGIKVLECHVFVCKSNQAAMALVQSCTHAFEHKEGWMNSQPSGGTRIIAASGGGGGKGTTRGGGFFSERSDLIQKFDVSCKVDDKPAAAPTAQPCVQPMMMVPMNPPGAPVPMCQPGMPMEYFADWNMYGGQPLMIIPNSPFYPGDEVIQKTKKKHKKKPKKKVAQDSGSETEETFYIKKSDLGGGSICGDSLRSRIKGRHGHGHGHGVHIEEIVQPCPQPPPPPKPCPPQIIFMPQPAPPPQPGPSFKNQQNPNTDVVVYAPQVIEANRRTENYQYDDRDTSVVDYHPDNRSYRANSERRLYDARADNRINYNRQNYRNDDYRADQRQFTNREDNRRLDYRGDFRSNRADNRHLSYRADNRSNRMSNQQAAEYNMYEPEVPYDYDALREEEFQQGYYDAQVQEYNQKLAEYNRQMAEYYDEEDDGYYPEEEYCSQPGFTDDYGVADYTRHLPAAAPEGRYELDYVDDYVVEYGPPTQAPTAGRDRFNQVADGLGYYP